MWASAVGSAFGLSLTALASVGLIGMALPDASATYTLFYSKPLRVLGKYSYGFYVYHDIFVWTWIQLLVLLMGTLHSMMLAGIIALTSNFVVTFIVAKLSYDLYEVKFLRLKRYMEYDSEQVEHRHTFIEELSVALEPNEEPQLEVPIGAPGSHQD